MGDSIKCIYHTGYALVGFNPLIVVVVVTIIPHDCNSDRLDHRTDNCIAHLVYNNKIKNQFFSIKSLAKYRIYHYKYIDVMNKISNWKCCPERDLNHQISLSLNILLVHYIMVYMMSTEIQLAFKNICIANRL